jgi:hypothetical protein
MTNASGAEVKDYDYQAFGKTQSQSGAMVNERTFTGHISDAETGLIYSLPNREVYYLVKMIEQNKWAYYDAIDRCGSWCIGK